MKIVLQPLHTFTTRDGRKIYEQILLRSEEGYPFAIVHIDSVDLVMPMTICTTEASR